MQKVKVIVVDDSRLIRDMFTKMLSTDLGIDVVATAEDPYDAREKIKQHNPDVITLDVEMPKMDGLTFLEKIMTLRPMPVVMASSLTTRGGDITIRALEIGAVDYIAKPKELESEGYISLKDELIWKVKQAARVKMAARRAQAKGMHPLTFTGDNSKSLIAIGASTGGVEAIRDVLMPFPVNAPPVVITQHMPEMFTASFANRLDSICAMNVHEARHGEKISPGNVYIAAGNYHLEVRQKEGGLFCVLNENPTVSGHRPSVDVMFNSVACIKGKNLCAALLTGMGRDGADGLLKLRQAGAHTFGQSEASCVVYGMPKAAFTIGAVEKELPLAEIPKNLLQSCGVVS